MAPSSTAQGDPNWWRGALAGLAAGIAGSLAMHVVQTVASRSSSGGGDGEDPRP